MASKIATLIVPKYDGWVQQSEWIEEELIEAFSGYSKYTGTGAWESEDGDVIEDEHVRYEIAFDPDDGVGVPWLEDIAFDTSIVLEQEAVYLAVRDADVRFV